MYKAVTLAGGIREPLLTCSISDIFLCSGRKLESSQGYTFIFGHSYLKEPKQSLANK